jgi:hypothetical protein
MNTGEKRPITGKGIWRRVARGIIRINNFIAAIKKVIFM